MLAHRVCVLVMLCAAAVRAQQYPAECRNSVRSSLGDNDTSLVYPANGEPYENNQDECWLLQCTGVVRVVLTAMHTEANYDYVSLFYHTEDPAAPFRREFRLSGEREGGSSYVGMGPAAVQFTSDRSETREGFSMEFECLGDIETPQPVVVPLPDVCDRRSTFIVDGPQTVSYPGNGGNYQNDENVCWRFECDGEVQLQWTAFETRASRFTSDFVSLYLQIGDNLFAHERTEAGDLSGTLPQFSGPGPVVMNFQSDYASTARGFTVSYQCVPGTQTPPPAPAPENSDDEACGPRVRKAWSSLSCEEREHYIAAVKALKQQRPGDYDRLVDMHVLQTRYAHGTSAFLPWHRWYILQYENMLRSVEGFECVTLPYWDWETDALSESRSSVFKKETFGEAKAGCVTTGVAAGWVTSSGGCLTRRFTSSVSFSGEATVMSLISTRRAYSDFAPRLEGAPHAAPHNFVGGDMSSFRSPDDPLFFLHHCNVDRLWALWQDYHGHNTIAKEELTETHYAPSGETDLLPQVQLDARLPYPYQPGGATMPEFAQRVTVRDMHDIQNLPGNHSYTYGNDNLAALLRSSTWQWFVPMQHQPRSCCGDGTRDGTETCDDGNKDDNDSCPNSCRIPGTDARGADVLSVPLPPNTQDQDKKSKGVHFSEKSVDAKWHELAGKGKPAGESDPSMIKKLADFECHLSGDNKAADDLWIVMMGCLQNRRFFTQCGVLQD